MRSQPCGQRQSPVTAHGDDYQRHGEHELCHQTPAAQRKSGVAAGLLFFPCVVFIGFRRNIRGFEPQRGNFLLHLSDKGFWDIAEHSTRPFAASHSNCRALAPHCRNLTDEMIRVMAEKGGLVGLNYCAGFLDDQPSPDLCRSTTALMAKHAAHFKQVGGIEIIGLGSDFDGIGGKLELSDCSKMPLLADALRKEGFTEDEVEAIFFRNAQRFFENNL